ncbi:MULTISPECIES: 50S ribosomal protein L6 [Desulfofundulus]|uniref:Large ribosomal subunit protein uL6 n=2 Tax=Desulfofundulus TaxID=2282741 RepID=A0A1M6G997_9FIRM|nr:MULTISPECIES: 50S ribosomal protein L6 [Desulfofundulus]MDQ0286140.1 large subunit ribosomal protein L6 [Desulfofundulus luciae]SHJ06492.1 large subunit ribosomal protein L6 [Desulfofundulus thermosubterraneus DSM 16057]
MSRIGKKPIALPQGVDVQIEGNTVRIKGPKGQLEREFHRDMRIRLDEEGRLVVERPSDEKNHRSLHGLTRTLLANMVEGVTKGFAKTLELVGVGYRATKQGNKLVLSVGYSHPVEIVPPPGLEIEVPAPNKIVVKGTDKEKVGALAAVIRGVREPEPYKGKGIRYENEQIRRKAGKAGGKGKK